MTTIQEGPDDEALASRLVDGLADVRRSPRDDGRVELIVRRPAQGERELLDEAELDPVEGLVGDDWSRRGSRHTPDGAPHPDMQLTLVNVRALRLIEPDPARRPLAGDQLHVDLDLSPGNLPPGTRLAVGTAEIEVTAKPHPGCAKFTKRFGAGATRLVLSPDGQALNLRGINTRVVRGGTVRVGDPIRRVTSG